MPLNARPLEIERGTEDLAPLSYWLGHTDTSEHAAHLRILCSNLAQAVRRRHELQPETRAGGMIINTSACVDGAPPPRAGWL